MGSQLFQPYRALGFVTNHVPFTLLRRGTENFVTTCIGDAFQVYSCDKLNLLFVSPGKNRPIAALASRDDYTYTASGNAVTIWKRAKQIGQLNGCTGGIIQLVFIGEFLFALTERSGVFIWDTSDQGGIDAEPSHLKLGSGFTPTVCLHPDTYLNKILIGSHEGSIQLWNFKTGKLIHTFAGWGDEVTAMVQSTAVDVVGIGLKSGDIIVHNVKTDVTLMKFHQEEGAVTSLSFRTDGEPVLAAGSSSGIVTIWDLEAQKLRTIMSDAHVGLVNRVEFLTGEPVLVTASGGDNALRMWVFDRSDGAARLLRSRSGHAAPPTKARFYGDDGKTLLTAGRDRALRLLSVIRDAQSREMSQGSLEKKAKQYGVSMQDLRLPMITDFAASSAHARDMDNVVTIHSQSAEAHTWRTENAAIGKHSLRPSPTDSKLAKSADFMDFSGVSGEKHRGKNAALPAHIKGAGEPLPNFSCAAVSACGNFALLGTSKGRVEKYNMQSGVHRGTVGNVAGSAHTTAVSGVVSDAANRVIITAGLDGALKYWDFRTLQPVATVAVGSAISAIVMHRESSLLAAACDDLTIRVYDTETRALVRSFTAHSNRITDMGFSPDGRWLISGGLDATVCVWDLPTARLLDWFRTDKPITSITVSPHHADYIATTHTGSLGIYLWANRMLFENVAVRPVDMQRPPPRVALPSTTDGEDIEEQEEDEADGAEAAHTEPTWPEATAVEGSGPLGTRSSKRRLLTLSSLPAAKWQNLSDLDAIRERNKPQEAPKAAEQAPFFLPTLPGITPRFISAADDKGLPKAGESRLLNMGSMGIVTRFQKLLRECHTVGDYTTLMEYLMKDLSPAAIDLEMRSLDLTDGFKDLHMVIDFLQTEMATERNFELLQAYTNLFLKIHSDVLATDAALLERCQGLLKQQKAQWERLESLFHSDLCLIGYFSNIR